MEARKEKFPRGWRWRVAALTGVALACSAAAAETAATNAFVRAMRTTVVPEFHFVPPKDKSALTFSGDPFSIEEGVVSNALADVTNDNTFAVHAKNLTMLELVDLLCFLADATYAFDGDRLSIAHTNQPAVRVQQSKKQQQALLAKLKGITIPEVTFRPPATILDAAEFFFQASANFDEPAMPVAQRGINFAVKNAAILKVKPTFEPGIPTICGFGGFYSLYDAVTQVCERVDGRFLIRNNTVVICPAVAGAGADPSADAP